MPFEAAPVLHRDGKTGVLGRAERAVDPSSLKVEGAILEGAEGLGGKSVVFGNGGSGKGFSQVDGQRAAFPEPLTPRSGVDDLVLVVAIIGGPPSSPDMEVVAASLPEKDLRRAQNPFIVPLVVEEPDRMKAGGPVIGDAGGRFRFGEGRALDLEDDVPFGPAKVGDSADLWERALELHGAGWKQLLKLDLRPHVVFAFAVKPASGGRAQVVEMGMEAPLFSGFPDFDRAKALEAIVNFLFLRIRCGN